MANLNQSGIIKLKKLILDTLVPEIDSGNLLLDVPDYDNIGDNLIWEGQLAFLKNVPYKLTYEASYLFYKQNQIPENAIILLQRGEILVISMQRPNLYH